MGLTLKYSVLPHPFAGPSPRAFHGAYPCTKYTIYKDSQTQATNALHCALYLHRRAFVVHPCLPEF